MDQLIQDRETTNLIIRRIPEEDLEPRSTPTNIPPLRLVFHPGRLCLEITRSNVILGRHSQSDIRLSLPDISRRHCRFLYSEDQWEVIDLESLNGIHVNDQRLHESVLCHGDLLRIGNLNFTVKLPHQIGADSSGHEDKMPTAMLKRIADVLPRPQAPQTEIYRQVS